MNLRKLYSLSIAAGLLSPACSIVVATASGAQNPLAAVTPPAKESTPELEASGHRVDQAKIKLDQARGQLGAARAMLKAAEAEYKAARADKDALAARTEARKLADASGLKDDGVLPVQPTAAMTFGTNRLYPATTSPTAPAPTATTPDLSKTRIQQADFNAPQKDDQDLTKANIDGAATPLRPAAEEQPNQVQ